jgi:deazaflavin-dependent oxidoreductase (nitroreductase family)
VCFDCCHNNYFTKSLLIGRSYVLDIVEFVNTIKDMRFISKKKAGTSMAIKFKIDAPRRIADGIGKTFLALHLAPKGNYLLTTIGRKSGKPWSTPVILMEEERQRWLVAPFGLVSWVYNARAAGQVTLTRNGKSETVAIKELSSQQAAPILRKYVTNVSVSRPYFDVSINSSEEDYIAEAPKHPVFELTSAPT